ncbi:MAG: hypothetical protein GX256_00690 [Fretibacterium sp.]|nr:hypothetical protein [Fretibacterium sp.]
MVTFGGVRLSGREELFAAAASSLQKALTQGAQLTEAEKRDALDKVETAQANVTRASFRMMDRHNEMVKKSQELAKVRFRQKAIEQRNRKRREDHSELLARMAIENAERSKFLNRSSWKRREQKAVPV